MMKVMCAWHPKFFGFEFVMSEGTEPASHGICPKCLKKLQVQELPSDAVGKDLRKKGFEVQQFDEYHHRVNGEFDFWTNEHGKPFTWHDLISGDWGKEPADQIVNFVVQRLSSPRPEVNKEQFVDRLVAIGWERKEAEESWSARKSPAAP
jgi:hypothetical protein